MKKVVMGVSALAILAGLLLGLGRQVSAFPPFKKAFDETYLKEGTAIHKALNGKTTCNMCHVGKDKKVRNDYGKALDKHLSKDDTKNADKIAAALKAVAGEHSKAGDEKSPTFGELIEQGKLQETP